MKCPYCDNEMEAGTINSQKIPEWKGENNKFLLYAKKSFTTNEMKAYHCQYCNKIVIEKAK